MVPLTRRRERLPPHARGWGGAAMREWRQTQLREARAQGLKLADYTKSRESLGGHCIGPRVISCQIDLSFVFDPGTASEGGKKPVYAYIFWKELLCFFLNRNLTTIFFALPDHPEKILNQLDGLSWHPICTAKSQNHCKTSYNVKPNLTELGNHLRSAH